MSFAKPDFRFIRTKTLRTVVVTTMLSIGFQVALASNDAADAAGTYAVTVPRGANTPLAFPAPANARCLLGAMKSPNNKRLSGISDARGIVRYFVTLNGTARTGVLATLECANSKAHTLVGLTLLPGVAAPNPAPVPTSRPATGNAPATTSRFGVLSGTPAGFDVTTASAAQLAQLNYPYRPDRRLSPTAFAVWQKLVTTPGAYVPAVAVPMPGEWTGVSLTHAPTLARASSRRLEPQYSTWNDVEPDLQECGSTVTQQEAPFSAATGSWNVPSVTTLYGLFAMSSTTVVLNYSLSMGTEQDAISIPSFGVISMYYAWYQVGGTRNAFNLAVGPGDYIQAFIDPSTGNAPGSFEIFDGWTMAQGNIPASPVVWNGASSAEWVEQQTQPSIPLAQFAPVTIFNPYGALPGDLAVYANGSEIDWSPGQSTPRVDDFQTTLQMTSTGAWAGDTKCSAAVQSGSGYQSNVSMTFDSPF